MNQQKTYNSYQQFHNKMKAKVKKQKQQRKQFLRQIDRKKKLVESSDGSNQDQYIKKTYKRGNKWWNKINKYYFQNFNDDFVENMRQLTTSEDLVEFGAQNCPLMNYYRTVICKSDSAQQSQIFLDTSIRIMFRLYNKLNQTEKHVLVGFLYRYPLKQAPDVQPLQQSWRLPQFYSFHQQQLNPRRVVEKIQQQTIANEVDIYLSGIQQDEEYITKCLQYETIWRNEAMTEIQKQIQCWKNQLETQHKKNQAMWDQIQSQIEKQQEVYPSYDEEQLQSKIQHYKKILVCTETISYFRLGYSDKSPQELQKVQPYVKQNDKQQQNVEKKQNNSENGQKQPQFFETDCKICFCTKNQPSNKVIYCDMCSTSFHQICYGIESFEQNDEVICDVCAYLKKLKGPRRQSPCCQICGRAKFPIKNIDNHFYHVSCLVLFNFASITQFQIKLKPGITHENIMQKVIQNEIDHEYCEYCVKHSTHGMQFKCSFSNCTKSFHPICAYLFGCIFTIKRKQDGGLDVKVQCRDHSMPTFKDRALQVFLRRYLCNYKNTAKMKQEQFRKKYAKQLQKSSRDAKFTQFSEGGMKRIMKINIDFIINQYNEKKVLSTIKKTESNTSNNSNSKSANLKQTPKAKKIQSSKQKLSGEKLS